MRKFIIYQTLFLFSLFAEERSLYILHTNNTNGALENCYCPEHPFGAIEKRSIFFQNFIKNNPNSIIVDSGDLLPVTSRPFLEGLVLDAYASLPYDAILVGDQELSRENKNDISEKTNHSILCANLENYETYGFNDIVVLERNGIKIGIIGTVHPSVFRFYPKEVKESIILEDPEETIRDFVYDFSDSLDLLIALTHQGHDKDVQLAESVFGLDVIVGSHSQTKLEEGDLVNDCLIVQAGKEGYYVGVVEITFDSDMEIVSHSSRIETMTLEMEDDPYIMKLIDSLEKETGHINRNKLKHQGKE